MKGKGTCTLSLYNEETKKTLVQFMIDGDVREELQRIKDTELKIEATKYSAKRSLNANAYYWKLVGEIAKATKRSNDYIHNEMLSSYGTPEVVGDKLVYVPIQNTEENFKQVMEANAYHLRRTTQLQTLADGKEYVVYMLMKGSHDYNKEEMRRLIDGAVQEAKDLGIETESPAELERIMALYGREN